MSANDLANAHLAGVLVGIASAFGVSRFIESLLFGVRPIDAVTIAAVVAIIIAAAIACGLPRGEPVAARSDRCTQS